MNIFIQAGIVATVGFFSGMYIGVRNMKINIRKLRESRTKETIAGLEWEPTTEWPENATIVGMKSSNKKESKNG